MTLTPQKPVIYSDYSDSMHDSKTEAKFSVYMSVCPFVPNLTQVVSTLHKTKPIPYQTPASQEEQIYEQISGQRVPSLSAKEIQ